MATAGAEHLEPAEMKSLVGCSHQALGSWLCTPLRSWELADPIPFRQCYWCPGPCQHLLWVHPVGFPSYITNTDPMTAYFALLFLYTKLYLHTQVCILESTSCFQKTGSLTGCSRIFTLEVSKLEVLWYIYTWDNLHKLGFVYIYTKRCMWSNIFGKCWAC